MIMQLPPPVHGASLINQYIKESILINDEFYCEYINLSTAESNEDIDKFRLGKYFTFFQIFIHYFKAVSKNRFNLVYITLSPHGYAFYKDSFFVILSKILHIKVVAHLHGKGINDIIINSSFKKFIYKFVFNKVYIICLSKHLSNDVKLIISNKLFILNNGIPVLNKNFDKNYNNINFLFLSNLHKSKGILNFLEAIKLLKSQTSIPFTVNIAGNETSTVKFNDINQFIKDNELKNEIKLLGPIHGKEKYSLLSNSTVFVLPTYYKNEAFPISILEAMQYGLATISTPEGGIGEIIINSHNGYLIQQSNITELSCRLLECINSPSEVESMGKNAFIDFNNKYTFKIFEKNFICIMQKILNNETANPKL